MAADLEYVKRRKRKKRAAIVSGISASVCTVLGIVAFLGRTTGTFTISLDTNAVRLTLDTDSSFDNQTSYLYLNTLPSMDLYTNWAINEVYPDAEMDSQDTDYLYGKIVDEETATITGIRFFKYTFYIKNVGNAIARYDLSINITDNVIDGKTGQSLDDILRVRLYDNSYEETAGGDTHNYKVYAKKRNYPQEDSHGNPVYDAEGNPIYREYVSYDTSHEKTLVDANFESTSTVVTRSVSGFLPNDIRRYTLLYWLEGSDPECSGMEPEKCSIKLGVQIKGYENN